MKYVGQNGINMFVNAVNKLFFLQRCLSKLPRLLTTFFFIVPSVFSMSATDGSAIFHTSC